MLSADRICLRCQMGELRADIQAGPPVGFSLANDDGMMGIVPVIDLIMFFAVHEPKAQLLQILDKLPGDPAPFLLSA